MVSRADVIAEAEKLIGVKWVHQGRSAKYGVDCIGVVGVVGYNLEIVEPAGIPNYARRPNRTFLPLFRATQLIEIKTTDGRSIRGLGLGFDDFSSRLRDASGDIHSYFHEEVRSAERKFESLMPSGYAESLSESELDDLLALSNIFSRFQYPWLGCVYRLP